MFPHNHRNSTKRHVQTMNRTQSQGQLLKSIKHTPRKTKPQKDETFLSLTNDTKWPSTFIYEFM